MMKLIYLLLFSITLFVNEVASAQTSSPSLPFVVNAVSGSGVVQNQIFDFSIGEMVLVQTFQATNVNLTQGFFQPLYLVKEILDVRVENNVLTPNGDGKNDVFIIGGIEKYPNNRLRIFDRAGRLIYANDNYQNDWNGYFNGSPLMEDTYYYQLDFGTDGKIKGFISILYKK